MKKVYTMILLSVAMFGKTFAQTFEWAKREGLYEYDYGYGIATDKSGNVYVSGKFEMDANFSGTTLTNAGNHDIYVARYTPSGALAWIRTAGGPHGDYARSLSCDGTYIYIAGEIEGHVPVNFGPSVSVTGRGDNDLFLAKYDLEGNILWARSEGGEGNEKAFGVCHDGAGNVLVCGKYTDTLTFSGGRTLIAKGSNDIFVAKYDPNGKLLWVKDAGGPSRDEALAVKCDAAGNVYVCGMYKNDCKFGTTVLKSPKSYLNSFLAKYDPSGNLLWVKSGGGDYDDVAWSLTMDNSGKIYVAGEFNAYAEFGDKNVTTAGSSDVFVACYDASGNVQWLKRAGGPLIDRARGIGTDGVNLYITGQFGASASFGNASVKAADSSDVFLASLSNSGTYKWAMAVGGVPDSLEDLGYESGNAVCAEGNGSVYFTGAILEGGKFGSANLSRYSRTDMFLAKVKHGDILVVTDIAAASGSGFSVYPNPGNGSFNLVLPENAGDKVEIDVYNMLGQSVKRQEFDRTGVALPLDLTGAGKGVYLVKLRTGDQEMNARLVIR
jgi:hypothetical protein